jgi:hypothetical protein
VQSKKITRREFASTVGGLVIVAAGRAGLSAPPPSIKSSIVFGFTPQTPQHTPVLPGLNIGRSFYEYDDNPPASGKRYAPAEGGGFAIHNGPDTYNHTLMGDGVWYLLVGDKPRLKMLHRTGEGSYATPGILPDLGTGGRLRLAVSCGGTTKWLDQFDSIDTQFATRIATWRCRDAAFDLSLQLEASPLIASNGFIVSATLRSDSSRAVSLSWAFGGIKERGDSVELKGSYARLTNPALRYTDVLAGPVQSECEIGLGAVNLLFDSDLLPSSDPDMPNPCALFKVQAESGPGKLAGSQFLCVWGYRDYNRQAVDEALLRLEDKPFPDGSWVTLMKKRWFQHWIGRALQPEKQFSAIRSRPNEALAESAMFWDAGKRMCIKTPDTAFDNVVNNEAANLRNQFEYPAFIHGLVGWSKYGKISCGYYGAETAGYHEEVESSLKFISGNQDRKGRQRYFTPAFAISNWAEEQDFYYVDQVWYHYRWTGSTDFLKTMWPSARRSLEHALAASDPDGDEIMTGYYEFWNNDMHSRGGKCVVQTAMAWAALRSATEIAKRVGDDSSVRRYGALSRKVYEQLHRSLWSAHVGAYCSAEWNGGLRPHPEAQEQFLPIVRGAGGPMEKYLAMRYLRETLFLRPQDGVTLELMNDWWPVGWSHHYVANGDTSLSVLAACRAGDIDNFWPALKTVSESAYRSQSATICHSQRNDGAGVGMKDIAELQGPFIQAVADGLFGLEPEFGDNLLVLRPNFPSHWDHAEISTPDLSYSFIQSSKQFSFACRTTVAREVRLEFPIHGRVKRVTVNGKEAAYSVSPDVNRARVVLHSSSRRNHRFLFEVDEAPTVGGQTNVIHKEPARCFVTNAAVRGVLDPQGKLRETVVHRRADSASEVSFVPATLGRCTIFLELESGDTHYLHPLDLDVVQPWRILTRHIPAFHSDGPAVCSPRLDPESKSLLIEIQNHTEKELHGPAAITIARQTFRQKLTIPSAKTAKLNMPLTALWSRLSPGSVPVCVEMAGLTNTCDAVFWELGRDSAFTDRLTRVDLTSYYNIDLRTLYAGSDFKWRLDYTGSGVGVDLRNPLPERDHLGYILKRSPMSQLIWGCLPEQLDCNPTPIWNIPDLQGVVHTPFGLSFSTDQRTKLMALANTRCWKALPSSASLRLETPLRLEKVYLLTANLTKTLKSYYPAGEITVVYTDGTSLLKQLIPPYSMDCVAQHFSPYCYAIPFGQLDGSPVIPKPQSTNLAVSDILLDSEKSVTQLEFRCVASETIFGILGVTLLKAPDS